MEKDVRRIQLTELEIMIKIKQVCDKYQLRYYLAYGTLLGAIRHEGFIPWDDDADIWMPAPDYVRFLKVAPKEFGDEFFLQTVATDPGYHYLFGKVMKNGTTALALSEKDLNIHWGIYVDVFPLVTYRSEDERKEEDNLTKSIVAFSQAEYRKMMGSNTTKKLKLIDKIPRFIRRCFSDYFMHKLLDHFDERNKLIPLAHQSLNSRLEFDFSDFIGEKRELLFEGIGFSVPTDAEKVLKQIYGDYLTPPPESERLGHERYGTDIIFDCENSYELYKMV